MKSFRKLIALLLAVTFALASVRPVNASGVVAFPQGSVVEPGKVLVPCLMKGVRYYPENLLRYDFIVDSGDTGLSGPSLKDESTKLINYFLASLTTPDIDLWVNLSPYEKDRIIPEKFGLTTMGRDLLAQDYLLKQLSASLLNPDTDTGKNFWARVYARAQKEYGTTTIPVNTFHKVWIVPDTAVVAVKGRVAYLTSARMKVMTETDYLATERSEAVPDSQAPPSDGISTEVLRQVVIPEIEREVNDGAMFAPLRQIYNAMVLAVWLKGKIARDMGGYVNGNKIAGVASGEADASRRIWQEYVQSFKQGVFNFVREDIDANTGELIPRKYFSGGFSGKDAAQKIRETSFDVAMAGDKDEVVPVVLVDASESTDVQAGSALEPKRDIARRGAVDWISGRIKKKMDFEGDGKKVVQLLRAGVQSVEINGYADGLINKIQEQFPLIAMNRVRSGDYLVRFSQGGIKALNDAFGQATNDINIAMRRTSNNSAVGSESIAHTFKEDVYALNGNMDDVMQRMSTALEQSMREMQAFVQQHANETGSPLSSEFEYKMSFGVSQVNADTEQSRIQADIESAVAVRLANIEGEPQAAFSLDRLDAVVKRGMEIWENVLYQKMPTETEIKRVRGLSLSGISNARLRAVKEFLLMLDCFDYNKPWFGDADKRKIEMNVLGKMVDDLGRVKSGQIVGEEAVQILARGASLDDVNNKYSRITSGAAFHRYAAQIANIKTFACDVRGFDAEIIKPSLLSVFEQYVADMGKDNNERRAALVRAMLKADDNIKDLLRAKIDRLVDLFGDSIPEVVLADGRRVKLINWEGGDEIVFALSPDVSIDDVFSEEVLRALSTLNLRVVGAKANTEDSPRKGEVGFALDYTRITHASYGEAFASASQSDTLAKIAEPWVKEFILFEDRDGWYTRYIKDARVITERYIDFLDYIDGVNVVAAAEQVVEESAAEGVFWMEGNNDSNKALVKNITTLVERVDVVIQKFLNKPQEAAKELRELIDKVRHLLSSKSEDGVFKWALQNTITLGYIERKDFHDIAKWGEGKWLKFPSQYMEDDVDVGNGFDFINILTPLVLRADVLARKNELPSEREAALVADARHGIGNILWFLAGLEAADHVPYAFCKGVLSNRDGVIQDLQYIEPKKVIRNTGKHFSQDAAMARKGGIDFNADRLNLYENNAQGDAAAFQVGAAMAEVDGYTPVILDIRRLGNLQGLAVDLIGGR